MLEVGKIYLVKTACGSVWLFKKSLGRDFRNKITSCHGALCLDDMYKTNEECYVCSGNEIEYLNDANENYISIWNRTFNDNVEMP